MNRRGFLSRALITALSILSPKAILGLLQSSPRGETPQTSRSRQPWKDSRFSLSPEQLEWINHEITCPSPLWKYLEERYGKPTAKLLSVFVEKVNAGE